MFSNNFGYSILSFLITFSIISKIYLPKEISTRIDLLFMKLIQCKIQKQSYEKKVYGDGLCPVIK